MSEGWVKIHRQMKDSDFWLSEKFTKPQAWVDLIMLANHKPKLLVIRGIEIQVNRGQCAYSELSLTKRWKWSRNKIRRFFGILSRSGKIEQQKTNVTSLITILKYEEYQNTEHQKVHQKDTKRYTNKNEKNEKKLNNVGFDRFWDAYDKKVGDKSKCLKKWLSLNQSERDLIFINLPAYINSTPDKKYRKNPMTYLNNSSWNDELICSDNSNLTLFERAF